MYKNAARKRHMEYDLNADIQKIRDAFAHTAKNMRHKANDSIAQSFDNAKERTHDFSDAVSNYAKDKPFKTIGFAMLAGLVVGFWLHRK